MGIGVGIGATIGVGKRRCNILIISGRCKRCHQTTVLYVRNVRELLEVGAAGLQCAGHARVSERVARRHIIDVSVGRSVAEDGRHRLAVVHRPAHAVAAVSTAQRAASWLRALGRCS